MSSQEPPASVLLNRSEASWYFFQNNSVGGPSSLDHILRLNQHGHDGKETLICRTDFKKWYPLREISHLVKAHEEFERTNAEDVRQFRSMASRHLEILEHIKDQTHVRPSIQIEEHTHAELDKKPQEAASQPITNLAPARYSHYLLRGRLRLGELKNSFVCAWIMMPLTFGVYWFFFLKRSFAELSWHAHNSFDPKERVRFLGMSLIPVVHIWYAFRLAKLMREAEQQNSYRKTKPLWVACLAIVPPLAVFHLQRRMNYHWRLHVKHFNATLSI